MAATDKTWVNNSPPQVDDSDLNGFKSENNALITSSGQLINTADNNQTTKAVAIYVAGGDFYIDSGSANSYVLTPQGTKLAPPSYFNGMRICFRPANNNSGASVVNVNSLGVIPLVDQSGNALLTGKITGGIYTQAQYNSSESKFRLIEGVNAEGAFVTVQDYQNIVPKIGENDTGIVNALIASPNPPYSTLTSARVWVSPAFTNTGAATFKLNSYAVHPINVMTPSGLAALTGGEMRAGGIYELYYLVGPAVWQLINPNLAAVRVPAQYARAIFVGAATQTVAASTSAKVAFNGGALGVGSWWDGTNFWFLPNIPGKYEITATVNSFGTAALQMLSLKSNVIDLYTALGVPGAPGDPYQLKIPGITVILDGSTNYIYLEWKNTSGALSTTLGTDSLSGLDADFTNFFEIKYVGT